MFGFLVLKACMLLLWYFHELDSTYLFKLGMEGWAGGLAPGFNKLTSVRVVCLRQDGITSLHVAAMFGHVNIVAALLEGKADVAAMQKVKP